MSGINTAQARALLKENWLTQETVDQIAQNTLATDLIENGSDITKAAAVTGRHEGKYLKLVPKTAPPAQTAVPYDGNMGDAHPLGSASSYGEIRYVMSQVSSTIPINDMAEVVAGASDRSIAMNLVERETTAHVMAARKVLNRALLTNNSAKLSSVAGSGNNWDDTNQQLVVADIRRYKIGMEIIPRHPTSGAVYTYQKSNRIRGDLIANWPTEGGKAMSMHITDIDPATSKIKVTDKNGNPIKQSGGSALGATAFNSHALYPYDGQNKRGWGLKNFAEEGNPQDCGFNPASPSTVDTEELKIKHFVGGIDRSLSANAWWRGNEFTATELVPGVTRASLEHLNEVLNQVDLRTEGDHGNLLIFAGYDTHRDLVSDMKRGDRTDFTISFPKKNGGFYQAVEWRFGYVCVEPDAEPTEWLGVEVDCLYRMEVEKFHADDTAGSIYNRKTDTWGRGMQEFDIYLLMKYNLLSDRNAAFFLTTGFTALK